MTRHNDTKLRTRSRLKTSPTKDKFRSDERHVNVTNRQSSLQLNVKIFQNVKSGVFSFLALKNRDF